MREVLGMVLVIIGACLFTNSHEFWGGVIFVLGLLCWAGKPSLQNYMDIIVPIMFISIIGVYAIEGGSWLWHQIAHWLQ